MARRPTIPDKHFKYLRDQRKISSHMHREWTASGREVIEYREHRRFTRHVYEEFDKDRGQAGYQTLNRVPIDLYGTFHKAILTAMAMGRWRVNAQPSKSIFHDATKKFEDTINWALEATDFNREVDRCRINNLDYGRGAMKTGIGPPKNLRALAAGGEVVFDPIMGERPLADILRMMGSESMNGGDVSKKLEPEEHLDFGFRRYPRGIVWQRSVSPEDVFVDFRARTPMDSGIIWQQHVMDEHTAEKYLKALNVNIPLKNLPSYELKDDDRFLDTEQERKRAHMWLKERPELPQMKLYKFYEGWWREEGLWYWECEYYDKGPLAILDWPAPEGVFPYTFWDESLRQDRLYPLSIFVGLQSDQDQINVLNSTVTEQVRQAKTIIFMLKSLIDDTERKNIERGQPLSTVMLKNQWKDSIEVVKLEADIKQKMETISHLEANARRRFGLSLERLGGASNVDNATQVMALNQNAQLQDSDRNRRQTEFLRDCVIMRQQFMALGYELWPDKGEGGRKLYEGAMGLTSNGEYYDMEVGFTKEEIHHPIRWEINVVSQSPLDAQNQFERVKEWFKIVMPHGSADPWGFSEYVYDLLEIRRPGLMRPRPETPDPHEEHAMILMGIPVQITEYEDFKRHIERHRAFEKIVEAKLNGQNPPMMDPLHLAYVDDEKNGGDPKTGTTALQRLKAHSDAYKSMMGGDASQAGQGLAKASTAPGAASEGRQHAKVRMEGQSGQVPFGATGKGGMGGPGY